MLALHAPAGARRQGRSSTWLTRSVRLRRKLWARPATRTGRWRSWAGRAAFADSRPSEPIPRLLPALTAGAHPIRGARPVSDALDQGRRAVYLLCRGGEADGRGGEPPAGGGRAGTPVALRRSGAGGAGRLDRRDDDRPAADAAARPAHLGEHRGGGDAVAGRHLRQRRAEDRHLPDAAAVDDAVSAGAGGLGHAPHPAARRRRARSFAPSATSWSPATWWSAR